MIPFIWAFLLLCCTKLYSEKAITYSLSGGRLGDNFVTYLNARWLSHKYQIPFVYVPFHYSDQLQLHQYDEMRIDTHHSYFTKQWKLKNEMDISNISGPALIIVTYFPLAEVELTTHPDWWPHRFKVDWKNPEFQQLIRMLISPRFFIPTLDMPKEPWITLAVHVRKGGNFDPAGTELQLPLKFPPDSFYISAIRKMSELFSHQEMYVYIFTDDLNPQEILNKYKEALPDQSNLYFDCRKSSNGPSHNVLEDFFSIQKFDCLIRPESNYTLIAEKLKDFAIVISPKDYHVEKSVVYIDTFHIEQNEATFN